MSDKSTEHPPHRSSPSSPSKRRQQGGQSAQPQPIAPAPTTGQSIAAAPSSAAGSNAPAAINTNAANASSSNAAKSPSSPASTRKRKAAEMSNDASAAGPSTDAATTTEDAPNSIVNQLAEAAAQPAQASPPAKKSRTNTPWTPAEERRLKTLRDAGSSWGEIAKEFPNRTEGSVKKHWYKDMHYADFAEDESAALLAAIREYESNKWKEIGKKVGKPAKACEQYAKENFQGKL